ncbi:hypothetical protein [Aquabacterium sp.]|uniref:hypothetical protein n=1 Tax=Aquabacterium sp. TaxID=1872578 RepID=UPI002B599A60|nr:hypothetical protein [Aquabacterium sp.]HSW08332.1 hypothetical protein [Aquabacterium sp.]
MDSLSSTPKAGPTLASLLAPRGSEVSDNQAGGEQFARLLSAKSDDKTPVFAKGSEGANGVASTDNADGADSADGTEADDDVAVDPSTSACPDTAGLQRPPLPPALQASVGDRPLCAARDLRDLPVSTTFARMNDAAAPVGSALLMSAPAVWEVSMQDSRGVAITLRAMRPADVQLAGQAAPWTLAISAPGLEAAALLRHAPRLDERLKARALTLTHVRIEGDDDASR